MAGISRATALRIGLVGLAAGLTLAWPAVPWAGGPQPRFFADDPIAREPETQDASGAQAWTIGLTGDILRNLFTTLGDPRTGVRAQNVNTIDEVPDSSWFTNRVYARPVPLDEIVRGPNELEGPAPGPWTIIRAKRSGVTPGFTIRDRTGEVWFITLDSRDNPVAPSAATIVATRLFWALGYNQVETHLASLHPDQLRIDDNVTITQHGRRRRFTRADLREVLGRAARADDGSYRVVAGRSVPGRVIGGFRYHGTRPDDPNDIVPHEHRRELRALQVFGAWTNLVDLKAGNTLDTVIVEDGRGIVRHYLQDVGSTFGTGALEPREPGEGYEHLFEGGPFARRLLTFGFSRPAWQRIPYHEHPEIGRFGGDGFDPEQWRPRVPVAALRHARPDDTFWAALRVMAFTDDQIRAAVRTGAYTDPAAEEILTQALVKRRDAIGRVYLAKVNPLVRFALDQAGALTFENAGVRAGLAGSDGGYRAAWSRFDNFSGVSDAIGETQSPDQSIRAPENLPLASGTFIKVSVSVVDPPHPSWAVPVDVYFVRSGNEWRLVGLERLP